MKPKQIGDVLKKTARGVAGSAAGAATGSLTGGGGGLMGHLASKKPGKRPSVPSGAKRGVGGVLKGLAETARAGGATGALTGGGGGAMAMAAKGGMRKDKPMARLERRDMHEDMSPAELRDYRKHMAQERGYRAEGKATRSMMASDATDVDTAWEREKRRAMRPVKPARRPGLPKR